MVFCSSIPVFNGQSCTILTVCASAGNEASALINTSNLLLHGPESSNLLLKLDCGALELSDDEVTNVDEI